MKMIHPTRYDMQMIKKVLPHRAPFLFVDRVVAYRTGDQIIAEKDLLPNEWYFSGHFPGSPIMPGVLVSEAMAQTCGLILGLARSENHGSDDPETQRFFLANLNVKFSSPAKPGETLRLEAGLKKRFGGVFLFNVSAFVENRRIASGTLALGEDRSAIRK